MCMQLQSLSCIGAVCQTLLMMQVKDNKESTLWQMLDLVLAQFDGIVAGYQAKHAAEPV